MLRLVAHDHGPAGPADPRVRRALTFALVPLAVLTLVALAVLWPGKVKAGDGGTGLARHLERGRVTSLTDVPCEDDAGARCPTARVEITSGADKGSVVSIDVGSGATSVDVRPGRDVVLAYEAAAPEDLRYRIVDAERRAPIYLLGLMFAAAVVALGRWKGLAALGGLAVSLVVLVKFALPALLNGADPLPIAITASAAILFTTLYLAHGFSARTSVAVLGTLVSLVLTGVLAGVFVEAARFTGAATEEALNLGAAAENVDLRGLLLAGVIIGSLGVLDDVTVTQASAVWELRAANPSYGVRDLYRSGIRIGRDHVASTVNTLVLAYAGASLPLLLIFSIARESLGAVITTEIVATEVVRTLVGSIGLVASVPVTTALAAFAAGYPRGGPAAAPTEDDEWIADLRRVAEDDPK